MKKLILITAMLLSGCTVFGAAQPEVQYVTKEVKVPVTIKCEKQNITKPKYVFTQAKKGDLLYTNLALLAAENDYLIAYTAKLEAALNACTKP
jgi:hypothetical protein